MSEPTSSRPGPGAGWETIAIAATIAVTAAIVLGYWAVRGFGEDDTEAMESPLMMAVARQLTDGPGGLYGPFGGSNPLVLIHAPLYYRVCGLLAWPLWRSGLPAVEAARVAGRLASAAGLLATIAAAYRLGRVGGGSRRAGWWSALLLAASPVLSGYPFAVRPDLLGAALQSWGVVLTLESIAEGRRRLVGASILFGLAACVKQHLLAAWGAGLALIVLTGRGGPGALARLVLPGIATASAIYGAEWVATSGRIWDSAFLAASRIGRIHPGDGDLVLILFLAIVDRSAGAGAMIAAGALGVAASRPGIGRSIAIVGAWGLVLAILSGASAHLYFTSGKSGAALFFAVDLAVGVGLIVGLAGIRRAEGSPVVAGSLAGLLAAELAMAAILARNSAGAWVNYGIPAAVFASALGARAVASAIERGAPRASRAAMVAASAAAVLAGLTTMKEALWEAGLTRALTSKIYEASQVPRSSMFFTGRPGLNRLNGRTELVYDDWLYPVFEAEGLAEPRSRWLARAIASGPVRAVVKGSPDPVLPGTSIDLRRLRYRPGLSVAPYFYMWVR